MKNHHWKDLIVWQRSHQLVISIYNLSVTIPESEKYNLISQLKRAVASVPDNIVEGHDRSSTNEFIRFLYISRGSLEEVRYFILLAKDLKYINETTYQEAEKKMF